MKYILTVFSITFFFAYSFGQSFEGKLVYKVDFQIDEAICNKMGVTKEMVVDKMKKEGKFYDEITYFIKKGNYIKTDNSHKKKRFVYKSEENKIYLFENNSDYVTIMSGENPSSLNNNSQKTKIQISRPDSVKTIQGDTCKLVKLKWGSLSDEYHWYNPSKVKIDYVLFERHHFEYLNKILEITKAFPLEMSKSVGELITITMTIEKIEEIKIEQNLFDIPELKKSKRKEDKFVEKITGNKVMRIKN